MEIANLLRMSRQIAGQQAAFPHDDAVRRTADHLHSFWTPAMIAELQACAKSTPDVVDPVVREALAQLRSRDASCATGRRTRPPR